MQAHALGVVERVVIGGGYEAETDGGWRWVVESVYIGILLISLFINVFEMFHSQSLQKQSLRYLTRSC